LNKDKKGENMNIQKHFLVVLGIATTLHISVAFGYWIANDNRADGQMIMKVIYDGAGICSAEKKLIGPGGNDGVQSGLCCVNRIELTAETGRAKGQTITLRPPNGTCNPMAAITENAADGSLIGRIENR
jgi:hypothetical protein